MRSLSVLSRRIVLLIKTAGFRCRFMTVNHANAYDRLDSSDAVEAGLLPQLPSYEERIKAIGLPPCGFVSVSMENAMMGPTERDRIFVADPAAERARLGKSQMMGVAGPPAANEAWLLGHELKVCAVAVASRLAQRKRALVDVPRNGIPYPLVAG
jgi:hypothetical protein